MIKETIEQFIKYIFVGGAAFAADAGVLWLTERYVGYMCGAAIAFVVGLIVNYILSKLFVFKEEKSNKAAEFLSYGVIGVIGLGLTELMMYALTEKLGLYFMLSKVITAAVVLVWNFGARKLILYRKG